MFPAIQRKNSFLPLWTLAKKK